MPRLVIINVALCASAVTVFPKTPFLFSLLTHFSGKIRNQAISSPQYTGPCDGENLSIIFTYALTFNFTTPLLVSKPFF